MGSDLEQQVYLFDGFALDMQRGGLSRKGREIFLRPQSLAVLEYFVQHTGELVSKEDLLSAVWGDRVVTDDSVTQCIIEIRAALNDPDRTKLRTIPRRGYQLNLPVTKRKPVTAGRHKISAIVIAAVLVLAVLYFLLNFSKVEQAEPASSQAESSSLARQLTDSPDSHDRGAVSGSSSQPRPSIAVLPFENRSSNSEQPYLADGIHDDLLATIAGIGALKVISRTSVMGYRNTAKTLPQIADELGVQHILEGSVEQLGDQVRINVQLIEAETDSHLWAEIFDRRLTAENLFAIRNEISHSIADALNAEFSVQQQPDVESNPTHSLVAFDAYLRGRQLMIYRDSQELEKAVEAFREAVEADPDFALAWVGLADSYSLLSENGTIAQTDTWPLRESAIDHALEIDPQLGEAYVSLGNLAYHKVMNGMTEYVDEAEKAFLKGIELRPNYARAYHWYSMLLNAAFPERIDESIGLMQSAAELDPRSAIIALNLGSVYRFRGLYALSERQYLKVTELNPGFARIHFVLANLYGEMGRLADAYVHAQKNIQLDPTNISSLDLMVDVFIEFGNYSAAAAIVAQMGDLAQDHVLTGMSKLELNMAQKDEEAATRMIAWLVENYEQFPAVVTAVSEMQLILGDIDSARTTLELIPGLMDLEQWPARVRREPIQACLIAWILMSTDEKEAGKRLLEMATAYIGEELPRVREHVDAYHPEICFLAAGDTERALQTIETQLEHNHISGWLIGHRSPIYDSIRDTPRYKAVLEDRNRRVAAQREQVMAMASTTPQNADPLPNR